MSWIAIIMARTGQENSFEARAERLSWYYIWDLNWDLGVCYFVDVNVGRWRLGSSVFVSVTHAIITTGDTLDVKLQNG